MRNLVLLILNLPDLKSSGTMPASAAMAMRSCLSSTCVENCAPSITYSCIGWPSTGRVYHAHDPWATASQVTPAGRLPSLAEQPRRQASAISLAGMMHRDMVLAL